MGKVKELEAEKKAKLERIKNLSEQARMLNYSGVPFVLTLIAQEVLPYLINEVETE